MLSRRGSKHLGPDESGAICRGEAPFQRGACQFERGCTSLRVGGPATSARLVAASISAVAPHYAAAATGGD